MNEEKFTDDNEFKELKKLLKDLPKVNAPDNFEFNLMTKIQNKSFEVKSEKKKGWLTWSLTPAFAFAMSVFLIFFVFTGEEESEDNPWNTLPRLMEESVTEAETPSIDKDQFEKKVTKKEIVKTSKPNNLATSKIVKEDYPFKEKSSINFDEYLQSDAPPSSDVGPRLATSQKSKESPFDGFFLRQRRDAQERDSIRKEKDSLQLEEKTDTSK